MDRIGANPPGGSRSGGRCAAIKEGGEPCKALPMNGSEWCWTHHPDNRQKHARNGARGGRLAGRGRPRKGSQELKELRAHLREIAAMVESGKLDPRVSNAISQNAHAQIRSIEVEQRVIEVEEYGQRMDAVEEALEAKRQGQRRSAW